MAVLSIKAAMSNLPPTRRFLAIQLKLFVVVYVQYKYNDNLSLF